MTSQQTRLKWPSGRINQIALVVCLIGAITNVYTLILQVFFAVKNEISEYPGVSVFTTIDLVISLLGLGLLVGLAIGKRYWLLSVAATMLLCSLMLVWLVTLVDFEQRMGIEIFITLFRAIAYSTAAIGLLRDERLSDIGLESEKRV